MYPTSFVSMRPWPVALLWEMNAEEFVSTLEIKASQAHVRAQ